MKKMDELRERLARVLSEAEQIRFEMMEEQIREMYGASPSEQSMVAQYGETMSRTQAAELLGITPQTITAMRQDGRLSGGSRQGVSTRSVARYLDGDKPSAQRMKRMAEYAATH